MSGAMLEIDGLDVSYGGVAPFAASRSRWRAARSWG